MTSVKATSNPVLAVHELGQSIWLDYIRRSFVQSGELKKLVNEDGLCGITSNPSIFEKAIGGSSDYNDSIKQLSTDLSLDVNTVYEKLALQDIQEAADILRPVYERTAGKDGYVSIEVSPLLASETAETIAQAKRLWKEIERPNIMIKVPGTKEGVPAIFELLRCGINVNVTLLFSQQQYEAVARAYVDALEARLKDGNSIDRVASVASFFVSRIDSAVDALINARLKEEKDEARCAELRGLLGKAAIANAKLAFLAFENIFAGERWQKLVQKGARVQRLLWASTSTKNPDYRDTIYIEQLIGPDTVNTVPPATLDSFRQHGIAKLTLNEDLDKAKDVFVNLAKYDIVMDAVTDKLLSQGVDLFADSFRQLMTVLSKQLAGSRGLTSNAKFSLPAPLAKKVQTEIAEWETQNKITQLWQRESSLWTGADEGKWLDWLTVVDNQIAGLSGLREFAGDIKNAKFTHAVLLGMGGSSLCPEVFTKTFPKVPGYPQLLVLDSTDPAAVKAIEENVDLASTVFIVSSKSGSTLEPNIFFQYFWHAVQKKLGKDSVGDRFVAVTDPGSKLQEIAEKKNFRHIFPGVSGIGGRYSALSNFGMVAAAIMGLDLAKFLALVESMVHACSASTSAQENPGLALGAVLGVCANNGLDKVTFVTAPEIYDLGAWLEQLLAESTGKHGKAIIPVDREYVGPPSVYGSDRLFVYLRLEESAALPELDKKIAALEEAGLAVVTIPIADRYHIGQEFYRFEFATAVAGSIMKINPFDQPDVEASKIASRALTTAFEQSGSLPAEAPFYEADGFKFYTDEVNAKAILDLVKEEKSAAAVLKAHLSRLKENDYFATLAYIQMTAAYEQVLQAFRHQIRDSKKVATCLGFGPRFLHSTGQAYKGGPNTGVFLQITAEDAFDLPVPEQKYGFSTVKAAQARGDFAVLSERHRRALRIHLPSPLPESLSRLARVIEQAIK